MAINRLPTVAKYGGIGITMEGAIKEGMLMVKPEDGMYYVVEELKGTKSNLMTYPSELLEYLRLSIKLPEEYDDEVILTSELFFAS